MPAGTISNGRTGRLTPASEAAVEQYRQMLEYGSRVRDMSSARQVARITAGLRLHACEIWLPGDCNLGCAHCYVGTRRARAPLSSDALVKIAVRLVREGMLDLLVPGMEPLLRRELWPIVEAARSAGAESIGITTNGTLVERSLAEITAVPLTVVNVSLDGDQSAHDQIRGRGVFRRVVRGLGKLRERWTGRIVTNTTVTRANHEVLPATAAVAESVGASYAAFHPFEKSDNADPNLAPPAGAASVAYRRVIEAFQRGATGSIALEADASTFDTIVGLCSDGLLDEAVLANDERGYLFLVLSSGTHELLVNLTAYPRHYVHTLRIADDGGLASCRSMARTEWRGIGDIRSQATLTLLRSQRVEHDAAMIWLEFAAALDRCKPADMDLFWDTIQTALERAHRPDCWSRIAA